MAKWIKNDDTVDHTYVGQLIPFGTYYEIQPEEELKWMNDSTLLSAIGSGEAVVAKDDSGSNDITDVNSAIDYLKDKDTQKDSDGALLSRKKVTSTGWSYHMQGVEFGISTLNSLVNKDETGADLGFATIKFYDNQDTELVAGTQAELDANCVKTVIDWEPTFDYEIIGGSLKMESQTTDDIYIYCIGVPDVPAQFGGSKEFISCVNMKYIAGHDSVDADGRASKLLTYDAVNHTNKMRMIFTHGVGIKCDFLMVFEVFKE